jgi:hypothetical protein
LATFKEYGAPGLFDIDSNGFEPFAVPFPGMILSLPLTRKVWPLLTSFGLRERSLIAVAVAIVLGGYALLNFRATVPVSDAVPQSYYQLLTEAFLSGRTYLSLVPDARMKTLPDPWAGAQGIPRAHDATYFNDKYYIYFGTGPVLLLFGPWHLLTGAYMRDGTGTGLFCAAGFLLAALFYLRCRRRYFPGISPWWTFAAVLVLGLGSFIPFVVSSPRIYDVPITCAFACCMLCAHAVLSAATAARSRDRALWILAASAAWSMAVASRPNYIFGVIPLWITMAVIFRRARRQFGPFSAVGFWLAAVVPVALVCSGDALYNYARFDNPLEFGTTYQLSAMDMRRTKLFALSNVGLSLKEYLLNGVHRSVNYPFLMQDTDVFGVIPWWPFAFLALGLPLTVLARGTRDHVWIPVLGFLLAGSLFNFASLLPLPFANERYELDFLPSVTLVALLVASVGLSAVADAPIWSRLAATAGILGVLAVSLFDSIASGLPAVSSGSDARALARFLNNPAERIERLKGVRYGPVEFDVEFKPGRKGRTEPLVATGGGGDCVFVEYLGSSQARFGYFHRGASGRLSEPVSLGAGRHRLRVDLGGLYPPPEHAAFSGWSDDDIVFLRRRVEVKLDGATILRASSAFYPSDAWQTSIGSTPDPGRMEPAFSGSIANVSRLGIPSRGGLASGLGTGPVRLVARFPEFKAIVGQPLVSTGVAGAGDLVYVFYLAPGKARFGHDCWNYGLFETQPVLFDPSEDQVIEVDLDSLHPPPNGGVHTFRLRFNGREVASAEGLANPSTPEEVAFGYNEIGASTAEVLFSGPKLEPERLAAMPSGQPPVGAVHLVLKLPSDLGNGSEPLVVTGRKGAADIVYIAYPEPGFVQFGYDHWGAGGPISGKIPVHAGESLEVQVSLSSLRYADDPQWPSLSAADRERLSSTVVVHANGARVFEAKSKPYACAPGEIYIGSNPAGGSTCSATFTGKIISSERIGVLYLR